MSFKIIQGGGESPEKTKLKSESKSEQLKLFVAHMRGLENSIASIKFMAQKIEWDELDSMLDVCHKQVIDALSFVKNSTKSKIEKINKFNNKKKVQLKLIPSNDKE